VTNIQSDGGEIYNILYIMHYYCKYEILSSFGKVDLKFYLKRKFFGIYWKFSSKLTKSNTVISTEVLILLLDLTGFSMWEIFTVIV